ncbi:MAG: hypothetical protein ACXVEE_14445 [Polyangiales bacterium]
MPRPWLIVPTACCILFGCQRAEHAAGADPSAKPASSANSAPQEITEKELLGHLLELYDKLEIHGDADVPVPSDRWSGRKIRLVGWVESSGPGDEGKLVARLKDKPSRASVLWCRFAEGTTRIPKAGETVTVEGSYSVSTRWIWQSPLAHWDTTLSLADCRVVPNANP